MKILLQLIALLFVFISSNSVANAQTSTDTIMNNLGHVFSEDENTVTFLSHIYGDETMIGGFDGRSDNGFIHIQFDIRRESKTQKGTGKESRYEMEVRTKENGYDCRLLQTSLTFYAGGKPNGHASLTFKWFEDDALSSFVLNYYQANRDIIFIRMKRDPFLLEEWNLLFARTLNPGDESHVVKLEVKKLYPPYGHIEFNCETLQFRTYSSTQPDIYSIASYDLLFTPIFDVFGNRTYSISQKTNWIKEFTSDGQLSNEIQLPPNFDPSSRELYESDFYRKILEYYQSHQAEMDEKYHNKHLQTTD